MYTFEEIHLREVLSKRHELAKEYAKVAHDDVGQIRKGSGARYWVHPLGVSDILEGYRASEPVCVAACLHDTVEDTEVSVQNIEDTFGSEVAELVSEVTNSPNLDGLDKEFYMSKKMTELSDDALTIKLGDCLYNLLDKPKKQQMVRMFNNIKFMMRNRKPKRIHRELISSFINGYKSQVNIIL